MRTTLATLVLVALFSQAAHAVQIVVDPHKGGSGYLLFDWVPAYPGPVSRRDSLRFYATHAFDVLFHIEDDLIPGDNVTNLKLNGIPVVWDFYRPGTGDRYQPGYLAVGEATLQLAANTTYILDMDAIPCSSGCSFGLAFIWSLTPLEHVEPTPVPEPTTIALAMLGLPLVVAAVRRRRGAYASMNAFIALDRSGATS